MDLIDFFSKLKSSNFLSIFFTSWKRFFASGLDQIFLSAVKVFKSTKSFLRVS